jgi:hypothetical protein
MAKQIIWTDQSFPSEDAAWKYIEQNYTVEKNYVMRNAKKAGKKVSVGVRKKGSYIIVIVIG